MSTVSNPVPLNATVDDVYKKVLAQLQDSATPGASKNAWFIIRLIIEIAVNLPIIGTNKDLVKQTVVQVTEKLVKGADDVQGTKDDIITLETANKIRFYLNDATISMVVDLVNDAISGQLVDTIKKSGCFCF